MQHVDVTAGNGGVITRIISILMAQSFHVAIRASIQFLASIECLLMQFALGTLMEWGEPCPFGASTLVDFRKRFSQEDMAAILEASIP